MQFLIWVRPAPLVYPTEMAFVLDHNPKLVELWVNLKFRADKVQTRGQIVIF